MTLENFDWLRFWLHFLFGAFIGALIGFIIGFGWFHLSSLASFAVLGVCAIAVGLLGGLYGDIFWEGFLGSRLFRFFAHWGW